MTTRKLAKGMSAAAFVSGSFHAYAFRSTQPQTPAPVDHLAEVAKRSRELAQQPDSDDAYQAARAAVFKAEDAGHTKEEIDAAWLRGRGSQPTMTTMRTYHVVLSDGEFVVAEQATPSAIVCSRASMTEAVDIMKQLNAVVRRTKK